VKKLFLITLLTITCFSAHAGGTWEDVFSTANSGTIIDDGNWVNGSLYMSSFRYKVYNLDGTAGNFSGSDTAEIIITGNGKTVSTPTALTKDELVTWAKANAEDIFRALFGSDPSSAGAGLSENTVEAVTKSEQIQSIDIGHFLSYQSEIKMTSEKSFITNGTNRAKATSGILNLKRKREKFKFGALLPYRYINSEDGFGTKSYSLGILPYYSRYQDINDNFSIAYTLNLLGKAQYIESDLFPDGAGYYEYGYGLAVSPGYMITDKTLLRATAAFNWSKKAIPSGMINSEMEWIEEAIDSISEQQTFMSSAAVVYSPVKPLNLKAEITRVQHLIKENVPEGTDKALYYVGEATYTYKKVSFTLGYKTISNVDNYNEHTYRASISYKF